MILSRKNKFTFLHCPKTGGSSVAVWLAAHLGPMDIQIGSWEDITAAGIRPNLRLYLDAFCPRRSVSTLTALARRDKALISTLSWSQKKLYRRALGDQPAHANAAAVKRFSPADWRTNFTFCFVRNPYARLFSYYNWVQGYRAQKAGSRQSFLDFLSELENTDQGPGRFADTWGFYTENDQIIVDFVGRFENLTEDLSHVATTLGLPFDPADFPHAKPGISSTHYRDAYGSEERKLADKFAAKECAYFGYEF